MMIEAIKCLRGLDVNTFALKSKEDMSLQSSSRFSKVLIRISNGKIHFNSQTSKISSFWCSNQKSKKATRGFGLVIK